VSGCPDYGPLLGGYVLGALEPSEMQEMRRHLAACPHCGPEVDRLAALPGLLDRIEPADVPPPALSARVEEEVLDRFARERRRTRRRRRLLRRPRRVLALAGAGAAALVVALVLVLSLSGEEDKPVYASVALGGLTASQEAAGSAELDSVPAGTHISLRAWGLPAKRGSEYEVWCIRADGRWISGGSFSPAPKGVTEAEFTAAVYAGDYHRMVVTRRLPDGDRGPAVLRGRLRY
jgi:anti-sigma-K factor RskA